MQSALAMGGGRDRLGGGGAHGRVNFIMELLGRMVLIHFSCQTISPAILPPRALVSTPMSVDRMSQMNRMSCPAYLAAGGGGVDTE